MSDVKFFLGLLREMNPEGWGEACALIVLYPLGVAFIVSMIVGLS